MSTAGRVFKVMGTGRGEVVFDGGSTGESGATVDWKPCREVQLTWAVLLAALTYTQLSEVFPGRSPPSALIPSVLTTQQSFYSPPLSPLN